MSRELHLLAADVLSFLSRHDAGHLTRQDLKREIGDAYRRYKLATGIDMEGTSD